jgi:hypothetical protein
MLWAPRVAQQAAAWPGEQSGGTTLNVEIARFAKAVASARRAPGIAGLLLRMLEGLRCDQALAVIDVDVHFVAVLRAHAHRDLR